MVLIFASSPFRRVQTSHHDSTFVPPWKDKSIITKRTLLSKSIEEAILGFTTPILNLHIEFLPFIHHRHV